MRQISEDKKVKVVIEFLNALSYDDIVEIVGVSKGSVVSIIDEFRNGTFTLPPGYTEYIDELRHLAVDLKKHNANVAQLKVYAMLHTKLKEMGANPEDAIEWLDLCREIASQNVSNSQFIESAFRLSCLTSETGMTYQELLTDLEAKLEKAKQLERNIEEETEKLNEVKLSHEREKKKAKETLDLLTRTIAGTQQSLEKQRKELKSQLDEYLIQYRLSWKRVKAVESLIVTGLNAASLTQKQKDSLYHQMADTGSILVVTDQLKQQIKVLQTKVSQLTKEIEARAGSIRKLKPEEANIRNAIATLMNEESKLQKKIDSAIDTQSQLSQEINENIESLYMCHLIVDFLFDKQRLNACDLDQLVDSLIALRQKRLGIAPKKAVDRFERVLCQCRLPAVHTRFDRYKIDIDHVRKQFAFLLTPLVKGEVVSKYHYEAAKAGYEIVQTGPRAFSYRKMKRPTVAVLQLPTVAEINIDNPK